MASLSGNVMHVHYCLSYFSLLVVRFVLSVVLRILFVVSHRFRDCLTPTPLPLPRPLPSALPSPPPRRSPHMSLDLSLVFVAHIAWYSFISHFTSIITSHARTHILFFLTLVLYIPVSTLHSSNDTL